MKMSRLTSALATAFILPGFLAGCAAETKCGFGGLYRRRSNYWLGGVAAQPPF
jgi:hypothetical protein